MTALPELEFEASVNGSVYVEPVGSCEIQLFCERFDELKTLIRVEELNEPWIGVRASLSRIRWRLLTWPLPVDSEPVDIIQSLNEVRATAQAVGAHDANRSVLDRCIDALAAVDSLMSSNPLGERVLDVVKTGERGHRGVVVLSQDAVAPTAEWIKDIVQDALVWSASAGNAIPIGQLLVLVGRPAQFCRQGVETNPFVTAPRAESTCFVQFDFLGSPQHVPGLLVPNAPGVSRRFFGGFEAPPLVADDVGTGGFDEIDWARFGRRANRVHSDQGDETVAARVLKFADGSFTFISVAEESSVQIAVSDQGGRIWLKSKHSHEVEVGDVIVLRTGAADSDNIRDLADAKFGATSHRPLIANWKSIVRKRVRLEGGVAAARRTITTGDLQITNLDHWITPDAIRPRHFKHFEAVSQFADIPKPEYLKIWDSMNAVFSAHLDAGQFIRSQLEAGLEGRSLESIEDSFFVEEEIDGFGTLRAARIARISPEPVEVPPRSIGDVFLDEEDI